MATTPNEVEKRVETQPTRAERTRMGRLYRPNVDICENDNELTLFADMPGASGENIDISFENGMLTIHGRVEPRQRQTDYLLREYGLGDFYRTFQVDETIAADRITAEYRDGVLILHLPKVEAAKPRKINVQAR